MNRRSPGRLIKTVFGVLAAWLAMSPFVGPAVAQDKLALGPGDHISIIGNVLPERMQHDGWLEAEIQSRFPQAEIVVRNLAISGDEVDTWHRSERFGSRDEWLTRLQTDVIFAFFGYNESFAGVTGLASFRARLDEFLLHAAQQRYNGQAPRVVLFSPIAFENLETANLPDGRRHNARLEMYTQAMAEIAANRGAVFVDLFHPTLDLFASEDQDAPFTLNGHYLTRGGNRAVARLIAQALFTSTPSETATAQGDAGQDLLRQAVVEKNYYWFQRYRTTDGYNVYGGRADEVYAGISNLEVMQREMEIIDAMTAAHDRRVWAAAQGRELVPDYSNLPPIIEAPTNRPGPLPDGSYEFLSGEESLTRMTVPSGMRVELVASEEQFPELINPVQMAFDPAGRLWVASWKSYPHWKPGAPFDDKLMILVDDDGDGRTDQAKVFASGLPNPTGFEFWGGGVLVACAPDLIFLRDTDGDDVADVRRRILHGLDSADSHHSANSFVVDPGGALYFQEGTFHRSQIETLDQGALRNNDGAVWRFEPRTWKIERYIAYDFANPHGHVFDRWGQGIVNDGTGAEPYHDTLFSGHLDYPAKHPAPPKVYQQPARPAAATEILSSSHFPPEYQGDFLVANVIGVQGILRFKLEQTGSTITGVQEENLVSSTDPNFRPVDIEVGPDGAVYFTDWMNPLIGHLQHHIRDPNRDVTHGRVYRIRMIDRPLLSPPEIAGQPIEDLLQLLKSPEDRVRYRTRLELSARNSQQVVTAAQSWVAELDPNDPEYQHHLTEALWLYQQHNVVNEGLLRRMLASREARARAAAVRVLCSWRDRVPGSLALVGEMAADSDPRVRLEAVRAASFFSVPAAIEVVATVAAQPTDEALRYTITETRRQLDPIWQTVLARGAPLGLSSDVAKAFVAANVSTEVLLESPPDRTVYREIMLRDDVSDERRRAATDALAALDQSSPLAVLIDVISSLEETPRQSDAAYALIRQLTSYPPAELAALRDDLIALTYDGQSLLARRIGFAAVVTADGSAEIGWRLALAGTDVNRLLNFVLAIPLIPDPNLQSELFPNLSSLATDGIEWMNGASPAGSLSLRSTAMEAMTTIRGRERDTFAVIAPLVEQPDHRDAAIAALLRIDRRYWPVEQAGPLADGVMAYISALPTDQRNTPEAIAAAQLAQQLAALLPADRAAEIRSSLGELAVRVERIGTLPHRMAFDQQRLVVQARRPVQIVFENSDLMPHNFVITRPGALEEVGLLSDAQAQALDAPIRQYVPRTVLQVLLSSRLLRPGESQTLSMIAPYNEGVYPFVCTFPGHWRRMYGALYVVADLDAYLADPETYLAEHDVPIRDEMLQLVRPRTAWTYEDLAPSVEALGMGRSFDRGKQMFEVAACMACHSLNDQGQAVGPNLAELDAAFKPLDILRELLEPSAKINEKFKSYTFELADGRVVTGLVQAETDEAVQVIENPLAGSAPLSISLRDIDQRVASETSLMPAGLLDGLTAEEILDLVAYIAARGQSGHMLFQGESHEH